MKASIMFKVFFCFFELKFFFNSIKECLFISFLLIATTNTNLFAQDKSTKLDTISIQLRYYHQFQFAGFYAAQAKGFYRNAGLYIKTIEYQNENILHSVIEKKSEFGVLGASLVRSKLKGKPIVLLKALYQHSPLTILTLKKNNLRSPSDLVGKKIMVNGRTPDVTFSSMFKDEGISVDSLLLVKHSFNFNDLITGKVDAATGYITSQPFFLKKKGFETFCIKPIDYGIDFYGDMLFTSVDEIKKNPERTNAFIKASMEGWKYAYENIDETADIILTLQSNRPYKLTKEMLLNEAEVSKSFVLPNIIELGHINPGRIKRMINTYKKFESIEANVSLDDLIYVQEKKTNVFDFKYFAAILVTILFLMLFFTLRISHLRKIIKERTGNLDLEVSERRLTEKQLTHEKTTNKAIVEASPDLMFRLSSDGVYLSANIPFGNKLGIVEKDIIGKRIEHVMPKEIAPVAQRAVTKALSSGELQFIEYAMPHNNVIKEFEARITSSAVDEVLVIVRDITEQKQKHKALMESEEKFYNIFHNSPDSIALTSINDGVIIEVNDGFSKISGYTRNEVIGKSAVELNIWKNISDRTIFITKLTKNKTIHSEYYGFRKKDGTIINCLVSAEIVKINSKNVVLGTYKNVTELVLKDKQLRESQMKFSKIFESSPIAIGITSYRDGRLIEINSQGLDLFGYDKNEILGKTTLELAMWKTLDHRDTYLETIIKNGSVKDFELSIKRKDGTSIQCSISSEVIELNDEKYIIGSLWDLSSIKKKEHELKQALTLVRDLKQKLQKENILLKQEINASFNVGNIITNSSLVKNELQKIQQVATTDSTVLIVGETGTGKELFARTIHSLSNRAEKPLIKVNCATLPSNLIESELFGHEKGAFTGAVKQHIGRFEMANKATIFLDEIGELPIEIQAKLLRVLQEGEFERVGSSKTMSIDVRIIAASNRDLQMMIEQGTFRADLFYRLNVFPINTIPLRDRHEDIQPLANSFIKQISTRIGKKITSIEATSFGALIKYSFPGNVRELQNIIERAIITTNSDILTVSLPVENKKNNSPKHKVVLEKEMIVEALSSSDWKIEGNDGAAKKIGIPPSTLRDQIKKHNLTKEHN
ncbi:MAG: sigma 54-interacting transcriptional regulator [Melioribacteraceae bacterium]